MSTFNVSTRKNLLSSISLSTISNHLKHRKLYANFIAAPVVAGLLALPIILPGQSFASTCSSGGNWSDAGSISGSTCTLGNFEPDKNDGIKGNVGAYVINGSDASGTVTINGNFSTIDPGVNPSAGDIINWDKIPDGALLNSDGSAAGQAGLQAWLDQIGQNTVKKVDLGDRVQKIGTDPITGGSKTFSIYGGFKGVDTSTKVTGTVNTSNKGSLDQQYVPDHKGDQPINEEENPGLTLGKATNGAVTDVKIEGDFAVNSKYSRLFIGEGAGSEVNWNTGKVTNFNFTAGTLYPQTGQENFIVSATKETGIFPDSLTLPDGTTWIIKATKNGELDVNATQANITAYNDHVVSLLLAGQTDWLLTQAQYDSYIGQAFQGTSTTKTGEKTFTYQKGKDSNIYGENDDAWLQNYSNDNIVIDLRTGARSTIGQNNGATTTGMNVTNGIAIRADGQGGGYLIENNAYVGSDNSVPATSHNAGTTYLNNGATGRNEGTLESSATAVNIKYSWDDADGINKGTDGTGQALNGEMFVNSKGAVINAKANGIDAWLQWGFGGTIRNFGTINAEGVGIALRDGSVKVLENNGLVNAGQIGLYMKSDYGTGTLTNSYIVNADVGIRIDESGSNIATNSGAINATSVGAYINGVNTNFSNNDGGEIYIGREAQDAIGQSVSDIALTDAYGVSVQLGNATNNGKITLGSQVANSSGMYLQLGTDKGSITNNSDITLKGGWDYANGTHLPVGMNTGMLILGNGNETSNRTATNNGTINLQGSNSAGVMVLGADDLNNIYSQGAYAKLTENSKIYVGDGYRDENLGIFYRNYGVYADGDYAKVDTNGLIDLQGIYAIATHARMGASIVVAADTNQVFNNVTGNLYEVEYVVKTDQYGRPLDEDGNVSATTGKPSAYKTDASGNKIVARDVMGNPIYKLDTNGKKIATSNGAGGISQGQVDASQIGYYIYGRSQNKDTNGDTHSSSITNIGKDLKVDSQGSILFRVEAGAEFHGNGESLTAEGMNSILLVGAGPDRDRTGALTGSGRYAQVVTNDAALNLIGEGSIGLFINGGAQGVISDASKIGDPTGTTINLKGDRTIAGIVDGRYWTLFNTAYTDNSGNIVEYNGTNGTQQSKLTNYSNVITDGTNNGSNVTGFVATNGGLIENHGYISLMNGDNNTGIHILAHGELVNSIDDPSKGSSSIVIGSGTGIHIEGESLLTSAKITNTGNIEVQDGTAGLLLDNNAFLHWNSGGGVNDKIIASGTAHGVLLAGAYTDWQGRKHGAAYGVMLGVSSIDVGQTAASVGNGVENDAESALIAFDDTVINVSSKSSGIRTATSLIGEQFTVEDGAFKYQQDGSGVNKTSRVTINVTDDGVGYDFRASDKNGGLSNVLTDDISITNGYTINVSGNATGIRTNTDTTTKNGTASSTAYAYSEATVNIAAGSTGTGWLAGTALNVVNAGTISSQSADALLVDLNNRDRSSYGDTKGTNFTNMGTLEASSYDVLAVRGSKYDDNFYFDNDKSAVRGTVDTGDGSDTLVWSNGSWEGSFSMGTGSNNVATIDGIKGINTSSFYHAEGSTGDGDKLVLANLGSGATTDTLSTSSLSTLADPLLGGSFTTDDLSRGINFGNQWENITLTNTHLELTDNLQFDHTGEFNIDEKSHVYAGNLGNRSISGTDSVTVYNSGVIDLTPNASLDYSRSSNAFKDRFTINGNYVGNNGEIWLDTYLDSDTPATDIAPSDQLVVVGGQVTGRTALVINGTGQQGLGSLTYYDGIKVVDAQDGAITTNDAFYISPKSQTYQATPDQRGAIMIYGSAYVYRLEKGSPGTSNPEVKTDVYSDGYWSNDWYLRSGPYTQPPVPPQPPTPTPTPTPTPDPIIPNPVPNPGPGKGPDPDAFYKSTVPAYEAYPAIIGAMERLPTLQQRLGNRQWIASPDDLLNKRVTNNALNGEAAQQALIMQGKNGLWFRWEGEHSRIEPRTSFTGSHSTLNYSNFQAGIDYRINDEDKEDALFGGIEVHYRTGEAKVRGSKYGTGKIKPDGIGFGTTMTWYGQNRAYIDLQAAVTFYRTDITSDYTKLDGKDKARGYTTSLSAEVGRSYELDDTWALTPQAQVQWTKFHFNDFTDKMGAEVSLNDGGVNVITRGGLALTKQESWTTDSDDHRRYFAYGIANIYYESKGTNEVNIGEVTVFNGLDRLSGGLGLGGTYNWKNDLYSLYGEFEARTSLNNFGDSYSYKGTIGIRHAF